MGDRPRAWLITGVSFFAGRSIVMTGKVLAEYANTPAAKSREMMSQYYGHEPGDPVKAAHAIIQAVDSSSPPMRLVLGPDALGAARAKLASLARNYNAWEQISGSTNAD